MNDFAWTLLIAMVGSGGVAAAVSGMFSRRKTGAETGELDARATEIVTRAAGEQMGRLQSEISDLRAQVADLRAENGTLDRKVDRLERREMVMRDLLVVHGGWDYRMQVELEKRLSPEQIETLGLYPAPPLYPPGQ